MISRRNEWTIQSASLKLNLIWEKYLLDKDKRIHGYKNIRIQGYTMIHKNTMIQGYKNARKIKWSCLNLIKSAGQVFLQFIPWSYKEKSSCQLVCVCMMCLSARVCVPDVFACLCVCVPDGFECLCVCAWCVCLWEKIGKDKNQKTVREKVLDLTPLFQCRNCANYTTALHRLNVNLIYLNVFILGYNGLDA